MAVNVEEHRKLIPFDGFISSTGPDGALMVTDIHIDPSKLDEYIKIATPVIQKMREMPECLWCGLSQNPEDPGHIRIQHGYTKGTDWFKANCETQTWFADYVKALAGNFADKSKGRTVAHFNRIPIDGI